MSSSKNRKSISVKGPTYWRFRDLCKQLGKSMSGYLEELLTERLDKEQGVVTQESPPAKLELWECNLGPRVRYVAATSPDEANGFVSKKLGMTSASFKLTRVEGHYDTSLLVPGILPPDEERAVLKSMGGEVIRLPVQDDPGVDVEHEQAPRPSRSPW